MQTSATVSLLAVEPERHDRSIASQRKDVGGDGLGGKKCFRAGLRFRDFGVELGTLTESVARLWQGSFTPSPLLAPASLRPEGEGRVILGAS